MSKMSWPRKLSMQRCFLFTFAAISVAPSLFNADSLSALGGETPAVAETAVAQDGAGTEQAEATKKSQSGASEQKLRRDADEKVMLHSRYLELVGGYRVGPNHLKGRAMNFASGSIDKLPGSKRWICNHFDQGKWLIELIEPDSMGEATQAVDSWPLMKAGRELYVRFDASQLRALGAMYLDEDTVIASGRSNYSRPFDPQFISIASFSGKETKKLKVNARGFGNAEQSLGGGFSRIPEPFAREHTGGRRIALACGGYEQNGSPFGPCMASFDPESPNDLGPMIYHPEARKETRDPAYWYPGGSQVPFWKSPNGDVGYWQGTECSFGAAWINHPKVKGVAFTGMHCRGPADYRAQGDYGGMSQFAINSPKHFFTHLREGKFLGHSNCYWAADVPPARIGYTLHIYDPEQIAEVLAGRRRPWDCDQVYCEIPIDGLPVRNNWIRATEISGIHWDDDRQLLWISLVAPSLEPPSATSMVLAAFRLVVDDARPEPPFVLHPGYSIDQEGLLGTPGAMVLTHRLERHPYDGRGETYNLLTCQVEDGTVKLRWEPHRYDYSWKDAQVRRRRGSPLGPYEVLQTFSGDEREYIDRDLEPGEQYWYMVTHRNKAGQIVEVAGKVRCTVAPQ